jgi:putative lipase involved disintegration of autophagic bodies
MLVLCAVMMAVWPCFILLVCTIEYCLQWVQQYNILAICQTIQKCCYVLLHINNRVNIIRHQLQAGIVNVKSVTEPLIAVLM